MSTSVKTQDKIREQVQVQSEKAKAAASLSLADLRGESKVSLQGIARDWVPGFTRMSKDELASAIFVMSDGLREVESALTRLVLSGDAPASVYELADVVADLLAVFFDSTPGRKDDRADFIRLAVSLARHILGLPLEPCSKSGYKVKFFKMLSENLKALSESELERTRSATAEVYLNALVTAELKPMYDLRSSITAKNTSVKPAVGIKGQPILDWVKKAMQSPDDLPVDRLSFAIAAATGRRMVEIHYYGSFELIEGDEEHILFSGQAKLRTRASKAPESYEIPLLVPASQVMAAVKSLRDRGGLWSSPDGKDQKYEAMTASKLAPKLCKEWGVEPWEITRFRVGEGGEQIEKKSTKCLTHSSMRKFYAQVIVWFYGQDQNDCNKIISRALGHSSSASGDESSLTSASFLEYLDEFVLSDFNIINKNRFQAE